MDLQALEELLTLNHELHRYYGLDWIALTTGVYGLYLIGSQKRVGFLLAVFCNFCFLLLSIWVSSIGMAFSSVLFMILHLRAWLKSKWRPTWRL